MIRYLFTRYKFMYKQDLQVNDIQMYLFFGQLYSYALFNEPLFENIEEVFTLIEVTDQQAYVLNCMLYGYKEYEYLYKANINLLHFEYFMINADKVDVNLDSWEW